MAQDDMFVIMYKMFAYFYSCMKSGETPQEVHYAHNGDLFNISYTYWVSILKELVVHRYISGVKLTKEMGGSIIVVSCNPSITMEGVAFLQENSSMKRALKFLKETKSSLPFL